MMVVSCSFLFCQMIMTLTALIRREGIENFNKLLQQAPLLSAFVFRTSDAEPLASVALKVKVRS